MGSTVLVRARAGEERACVVRRSALGFRPQENAILQPRGRLEAQALERLVDGFRPWVRFCIPKAASCEEASRQASLPATTVRRC